jgi:hypothetical protein
MRYYAPPLVRSCGKIDRTQSQVVSLGLTTAYAETVGKEYSYMEYVQEVIGIVPSRKRC